MNIFLDIETIPDQRPGALSDAKTRVKVPANYKNVETIANYIDEHADEAWRNTALNGAWGELYCVTFACEDYEPMTIARGEPWNQDGAERLVLETLNDALAKALGGRRPHYIGHNVEFDLRFLFHRVVVNQIKPAFSIPYNEVSWRGAYYDTHYAWTGKTGSRSGKDGIKLKELCDALSIPIGDNDIDGSEVWDAVQAGRHADVIAHCEADVERVRMVYRRLTFDTP